MNTSPSPFSAHKDVLEASIPIPGDGAAEKGKRQSLLEECKRRAKGAVQSQCWPDAAALYDKALQCTCCNGNDNNNDTAATTTTTTKDADDAEECECAILNANLSLVHGKMNQWSKAMTCAQQATRQNPLYTKAWWRLGQAQASLQQYDDAIKSLQQALSLEPNNKALEKELVKLKEQQQQQQQHPATAPTTVTTRTVTKSSSSTTATTATTATTTTTTTTMDIDKDTVSNVVNKSKTSSSSEPFKGYKIVNGKKTTYFHNELTQEAKQLIGDIAPKKLDSSSAAALAAAASTIANTDTSAWNKAGTWEERDVTKWAMETLPQTLLDPKRALYTLPLSSAAPNATVTTTSVKVLSEGHASVATVRGKKRYLYDFAIKVEWKFQHGESTTAHGSIEFPDVAVGTGGIGGGGGGEDNSGGGGAATAEAADGDDDDDCALEATNFTVAHADDETLRPILQTFVHHDGWRNLIQAAIFDWVKLFKETY